MQAPRYCPFYCEENIWQLAQDREVVPAGARAWVVFISNADGRVALWGQRLASDPALPVVWDYHVVLAVVREGNSAIWDLDTTLGLPVDAGLYLAQTFRTDDPMFAPRFRWVDTPTFVGRFASDRSHMRDETGAWSEPPPPWPAPRPRDADGPVSNLMAFVDTSGDFLGDVGDLSAFADHLAAPSV